MTLHHLPQPARRPAPDPDDWRDHAACQGKPAEWWFPTDGFADHAKIICAQCPVAEPCLAHAIANRERHGVWGGFDLEREHRLARNAAAAARARRRRREGR